MQKETTSTFKGKTGLTRIVRAFGYSLKGLRATWRDEAAFRQECVLAIVLLPAAFWVGRTAVEIFLLCATVMLVLMLELVNSGLEALADAISLEHHPLLGKAKDIGSAAVLLALILTAGWWGYILVDRFDLN